MEKIGIHDPTITKEEYAEVAGTLDSGWLSSGGLKSVAFENKLGEFLRVSCQPLATTSGTAALKLAARVAGIQSGDHVLVSAYGFIATANAIKHLGGEPIFLGPENPLFPVVTFSQVRQFLQNQLTPQGLFKKTGRPVKGLFYNEPYGLCCPQIGEFRGLLDSRGMFFVEDAAQSFGVEWDGSHLGTFGHLGVYSFNGNKTLAVGQGGALTGSKQEWLAMAKRLSSQDRTDDFDFYYGDAAYNVQISNLLAALGLAQLKNMQEILRQKSKIRRWYREAFLGSELSLLASELDYPAWLNIVLFPKPMDRGHFRRLASEMGEAGIQIRPTFPAVPRNQLYKNAPLFQNETIDAVFDRGICLPSGASLHTSQVERIAKLLLEKSKKLGFL